MTTISIIETKKEEIIKFLKENTYQYNGGDLDKDTINTLSINSDTDELTDWLVQINHECGDELFEIILSKFDIDEDNLDIDETIELKEFIQDYMVISFENWFKDIKVLVQIPMLSNYDCINSYSDRVFDTKEHYIADVLDMLNLNRKDFKAELNNNGFSFSGTWRNEKSKLGKEIVDMKPFVTEVQHLSCGGNLLTFVLNATLWDLFNADTFNNLEVTIPKGTLIGFLSTFQGGGTNYDARTKQDFKVTLKDHFCKGYKPFFRLDLASEYKYNYKNIYGDDARDEPLLIIHN